MSEQRGRVRVEAGHKRVRAYLDGEAVVDTTTPLLVWEIPYYPAYYVPVADVRTDLLVPNGRTEHSPSRGEAQYFTVKTGGREVAGRGVAVPRLTDRGASGPRARRLEGDGRLVRGGRGGVHPPPRPPQPCRHPPQLPARRGARRRREDRRHDPPDAPVRDRLARPLLRPADRRAHGPAHADRHRDGLPLQGVRPLLDGRHRCRTHEDLAWSYRSPFHESHKIAGLVSFYNEKVDLVVDGVAQERPRTPFS